MHLCPFGIPNLNPAPYVLRKFDKAAIRESVITVVVASIYRWPLHMLGIIAAPHEQKVTESKIALNACVGRLYGASLLDNSEQSLQAKPQRVAVGFKTADSLPRLFALVVISIPLVLCHCCATPLRMISAARTFSSCIALFERSRQSGEQYFCHFVTILIFLPQRRHLIFGIDIRLGLI